MIVCFGEPLLDVFASPVGATFEDAEVFVPRPGGAPLNVAMVLGMAGVPTRFVGSVGADALGGRIVRSLREAGVDPGAVTRSPRQTGMVLIQVGLDGSREFLGYAESGAEYDYTPDHYDRARPEPLAGAAWLVVGSGSIAREAMAPALRHVVLRARALGVPVVVDLNVRPPLWTNRAAMIEGCRWLSAQASVLRASEEDLAALGLAPRLASLWELNRDAAGILTLGKEGAAAVVGSAELRCAAPEVRVVDTTGAGDAFTGGLVAHLFATGMHPRKPSATSFENPRRWEEALACACRFGSHCCTALGCSEAFRLQPIRCEHGEAKP